MLLAFGQQLRPYFLTDWSQGIQMLGELLSATARAGFGQLFQPGMTTAWRIDLLTSTGNRPTTIERLETIPYPSEVLGHSDIATTSSRSVRTFSAINRRKKSRAQQITRFPAST